MYADEIKERLEEHRKETMRENDISDWFIIASNGSMNYNLDTPESDIDSKLLTVPSLKQLINNDRNNFLHVMSDNGEHCEVKDIAVYTKTILKQNINFVETLFAKGVLVNPRYEYEWKQLVKNREMIARYDTIRAAKCMQGMMIQKQKDMVTMTEGRRESIERIGYDAKSFHHIVRLYLFLCKYSCGIKYQDCLTNHGWHSYEIASDYDILTWSKQGKFNYDSAVGLSYEMIEDAIDIVDKMVEKGCSDEELHNRWEVKNLIDDVVYNVIKKHVSSCYNM